jgi:HSP20 family molecular chaperone IbpA
MSDKTLEAQKQELSTADDTERTRECPCFIPRADIYETDEAIMVLVDLPGVDENSLDITLEKNVLTINGYTEPPKMEGYQLGYHEYEVGDYTRSFHLSDEIDREGIEASMKNGVLHLRLPKAGPAKARKISVKAG